MLDLSCVLDQDTPLAIAVVDAVGTVSYFNDYLSLRSGVTPETARGQPFNKIFPEVEQQNWPFHIKANTLLRLPDPFVLHISTSQGRLHALLCFPFDAGQGKQAFALLFYDPDDWPKHHQQFSRVIQSLQKIQLERHASLLLQLEQSHVHLLHNEKMAGIGQLAAGIAHEINNPMGYVFSNLKTLESYMQDMLKIIDAIEHVTSTDQLRQLKRTLEYDYIRNDIEDLINESEEGVERVKKIISALKYFSHSDDETFRAADLNQGIESTLIVAGNEIKYKAHIITELGELPEVVCNISQINQVVMNLLINAAHAMAESGTITIRSAYESGSVWFEVEDTGAGMDETTARRVFDPFFTTKPVGQGTGLGLALSDNIIKKHNGRIDLKTKLGKGSTFRVWLPLDASQPPK